MNKYRVIACKSSYQLCRFAEQSNFDKKMFRNYYNQRRLPYDFKFRLLLFESRLLLFTFRLLVCSQKVALIISRSATFWV